MTLHQYPLLCHSIHCQSSQDRERGSLSYDKDEIIRRYSVYILLLSINTNITTIIFLLHFFSIYLLHHIHWSIVTSSIPHPGAVDHGQGRLARSSDHLSRGLSKTASSPMSFANAKSWESSSTQPGKRLPKTMEHHHVQCVNPVSIAISNSYVTVITRG